MEPRNKDGLAGGMVVALFDTRQAQGFARSDRAQSLGFETFRLFQHGGIEDSATLPPLGLPTGQSGCLLARPEKLIDLLGFPPLVVDERAQPFRSSPLAKPVHVASQFREQ
jgi:hypothetical protein